MVSLIAAPCVLLCGCGALLYPEGTFYSGCPLPPLPSVADSSLAGTWTGTVTVTVIDQATGQTTTSQQQITVSFDQFGQPIGNDSPWPPEWPLCFVAGARVVHKTNVCPGEPWRIPQQQSVETITLREADFAESSFRLAWSRWYDQARCSEGYVKTEFERRVYVAALEGEVLNWTSRFEENRDFSWSTQASGPIVMVMQGQLRRP